MSTVKWNSSLIMYLIFGGLAAWLLLAGWGQFIRNVYLNSVALPIEAEVIHKRISVQSTKDPEYMGGGTSETYYPVVTFVYQVNGQEYQAKSPFALKEGFSSRVARKWLDQFPYRVKIPAFVHPRDPTIAFLHKRVKPFTGMIINFGFFFLAYLMSWVMDELGKGKIAEDRAFYSTLLGGNALFFLAYFLAGGRFDLWLIIQLVFCTPGFWVLKQSLRIKTEAGERKLLGN